jgi:hypothetical protein
MMLATFWQRRLLERGVDLSVVLSKGGFKCRWFLLFWLFLFGMERVAMVLWGRMLWWRRLFEGV